MNSMKFRILCILCVVCARARASFGNFSFCNFPREKMKEIKKKKKMMMMMEKNREVV